MKRLIVIVLSVFGLSCQAGRHDTPAIEPRPAPEITIISKDSTRFSIEERMQYHGVPGLSVAVFIDGNLEWAKGYGIADLETETPVTTSTLFQAASISKPVVAAALLRLAEENRIDLDENINHYLSSWKLSENEMTTSEKVTARRLLNHTSGIAVGHFPGYSRSETIPSATEVARGRGNTDSLYVRNVPGERWDYSGGGYVVLQIAMTDATGTPFDDLMRQKIFTPLDMTSSTFEQPLPSHLHGLAATGYTRDRLALDGQWNVYPEQAAAGLWTTPTDLGKFAVMLQQARAGTPGLVLGPSTVTEMLTPDNNDYGLGPAIRLGGSHFGHGGSNSGFQSELLASISGDHVVVVMTNSDNGYPLNYEVIRAIFRHYGWTGY